MNRIKKDINDHIMRNYMHLFSDLEVSKSEILTNTKLLSKAKNELLLSNEPTKLPEDLL